jgi:hypothetical protein
MRIESSGHSRGNPRLYELVEHSPKTGKSPTVWAWPELMDYLKIAGQPVPGPWPPHQQPRPDPEEDSLPVAVAEPELAARPTNERRAAAPADQPPSGTPEPGPATPALGGSEAADAPGVTDAGKPSPWRHPESSLGDRPYGH